MARWSRGSAVWGVVNSHAAWAIWGVNNWNVNKVWGWHNTDTGAQTVDRFDGSAYWGRGYWVEDFWLTW